MIGAHHQPDQVGHDAGDRALRTFARVMRRAVREADARLARNPGVVASFSRALTDWMNKQNAAEGRPEWTWTEWIPLNLFRMVALSPELQVA